VADESLFTTQLPDSGLTDASDGGSGLERGTTMYATAAGNIKGIRWYSSITAPPNTPTLELYSPISDSDGTRLATKAYTGTHTGGTWQTQLFDTPVHVAANQYFVPVVSQDTRYVAAVNFFTSAGLSHGHLVAIQSGTDPLGAGFNQANGKLEFDGPGKFPGIDSGNQASYLVDVIFEADPIEVDLDTTDSAAVAEVLAAAVTAAVADSATLADTTAAAIAAATSDAGTLADTASAIAAATTTDTGAVADAQTVTVAAAVADSGALAETTALSATGSASDAASLTDAVVVDILGRAAPSDAAHYSGPQRATHYAGPQTAVNVQ